MATHFPTVPVGRALREAHPHRADRFKPLALIVNSDPVIAATLDAILRHNGLATMTETDPRAAREAALLIPPQILIAEATMPALTGVDLALEVSNTTPDCDVILFLAQGSMPSLAARMCSVRYRFVMLVKPVHPADLLDAIHHLLGRRGMPFCLPRTHRTRSPFDFLSFAPATEGDSSETWIGIRHRRFHGPSIVN